MGSWRCLRGCLLARSSPSVTPRYEIARLIMWLSFRELNLPPQWRGCEKRCGLGFENVTEDFNNLIGSGAPFIATQA